MAKVQGDEGSDSVYRDKGSGSVYRDKGSLQTYVSLLPRRVVEHCIKISNEDGEQLRATAESFDAGVLFADISGFSKLAEKLTKDLGDGAKAAEQLSKHIGESRIKWSHVLVITGRCDQICWRCRPRNNSLRGF